MQKGKIQNEKIFYNYLTNKSKKYRINKRRMKKWGKSEMMKSTNVKNKLNKIKMIQIAETLAAVHTHTPDCWTKAFFVEQNNEIK